MPHPTGYWKAKWITTSGIYRISEHMCEYCDVLVCAVKWKHSAIVCVVIRETGVKVMAWCRHSIGQPSDCFYKMVRHAT